MRQHKRSTSGPTAIVIGIINNRRNHTERAASFAQLLCCADTHSSQIIRQTCFKWRNVTGYYRVGRNNNYVLIMLGLSQIDFVSRTRGAANNMCF